MLNPASHIIALLGGPQATAELAGVHISRVFRWTYPKARGGTGGLVPAQHQQHLLESARARGIALEPADFFRRSPSQEDRSEDLNCGECSDGSTHSEVEYSSVTESRPDVSKKGASNGEAA